MRVSTALLIVAHNALQQLLLLLFHIACLAAAHASYH
jgi:hypothetical protein